MASIRGSQVTRFAIDDAGGTSRDLTNQVDGEVDVTVRSGPALARRSQGSDPVARYTAYAPEDIQIDVPLIPDDAATTGSLDVILMPKDNQRSFELEIEIGATNRGFRIAGECMVDEVVLTFRNAEGDAGMLVPLKPFGNAWTVTSSGL